MMWAVGVLAGALLFAAFGVQGMTRDARRCDGACGSCGSGCDPNHEPVQIEGRR